MQIKKVTTAATHPLLLTGQRIRSFGASAGVHVLALVGVHGVLVGSAHRARPVTSEGHTEADDVDEDTTLIAHSYTNATYF